MIVMFNAGGLVVQVLLVHTNPEKAKAEFEAFDELKAKGIQAKMRAAMGGQE